MTGPDSAGNFKGLAYVPTKEPKDTLASVYAAGRYKAALRLDVLILQTFMAGIYIGAGSQFSLQVYGGMTTVHEENPSLQKLAYGAVFPMGLIAVVLMGAELFTSDALVFVAALLAKRVTVTQLLRNWSVAWLGNYAGCLAWAYFMTYLTEAFSVDPYRASVIALTEAKASAAWGVLVLKGIGANFLVCLSVWLATMSADVAGKILAIWWPIVAFITCGFEHSIADMYVSAAGMMYGADVSVYCCLFKLLIPVTIGNIIGGGVFVGAMYWYIYDKTAAHVSKAGGLSSYYSPEASRSKEREHAEAVGRQWQPATAAAPAAEA